MLALPQKIVREFKKVQDELQDFEDSKALRKAKRKEEYVIGLSLIDAKLKIL